MVILPVSAMTLFVSIPKGADAQLAITEVIKAGVKKVIKAVDLKVQRLQNKTIWLQNAQKVLENQLSKLKLSEIADWTEKQKALYGKYYQELWQVKSAIAYYQQIKDLIKLQASIVSEYKSAWKCFQQDTHFSTEEKTYMSKVYTGMLEESIKNLDQVLLVVNSFKTQMTDGERLELLTNAAAKIQTTANDLKQFNQQNIHLSLQRSHSSEELQTLKQLYGLQ